MLINFSANVATVSITSGSSFHFKCEIVFCDIFAEILGMISRNPPFNCTISSYFGLMTIPKQPSHHQNDPLAIVRRWGDSPKGHVLEVCLELDELSTKSIGNILWLTNLLLYLANPQKRAPPFFSGEFLPPFCFVGNWTVPTRVDR